MKKILFLCTGNYYRSRFAEYLFNEQAKKHQLSWQADSRALALQLGVNNIGLVSPHALVRLKQLGIDCDFHREPQQVTEVDLRNSDKIIALDQDEHRPFVAQLFPEWLDKIDYWVVHDLHLTVPNTALTQIEQHIHHLVNSLKS